jgi:glycosyltransferase involved in cell wall biosynthesis
MRIVIDLQGAQSGSRHRGIGRYSLALAHAMVRNRGDHEVIIALNGLFPDSIEAIRADFDGKLPQQNIVVWNAPGPVHNADPANTWRRHAAELIRETFLASLQPDIIHITSLFEGFDDNSVNSIGLSTDALPTAVTFYDLIPLLQSEVYLTPHPIFARFYQEKLAFLKQADIYLAISESARQESIDFLDASPEQAVNIGAAVDDHFKPVSISAEQESALRKRFGLNRRFLMYSGATDERKNHLRLIKAFSLLPANIRETYQLAIVGGLPGPHRQKFEDYTNYSGLTASEVVITGRVSDEEMVQLYNLCDLFVFPSWHEGFGLPALEAMSCGAPVIVANTTSLPEVIGREDALFNPFSEKDIAAKITEVLNDDELRLDLAKHGLERSKAYSWDATAKITISAFELWHGKQYKNSVSVSNRKSNSVFTSWLVEKISSLAPPLDENDWLKTAQAIAQNHPVTGKSQLLVDISELAQRDSKTGVQRVVRSILTELLENPPKGFRVEPVYAEQNGTGYRYARKFTSGFLAKIDNSDVEDSPIDAVSGDIFFGLDLIHSATINNADYFKELRRNGLRVYFLVHDLLPVLKPELFPDAVPLLHARWLLAIAESDGVICVSRTVADELRDWLGLFGGKRLRPFNIGWSHNAADFAGSVPTKGLPADAASVLDVLSVRPTFLMVGTIEPRKGQMQTLMAFEQLWEQGLDVNLVIVGKHGWNVDLLVDMLRSHSERNKRLFWLEGISDEYLEKVYAASTCLISASEGEGFGLPLIESALHKKPIIARDLPVFQEVAGEHAFYFSGLKPESLANAVREWLALDKLGQAPQSDKMPWLTWKQSTKNLLDVMLSGQWHSQWMPDDIYRFLGSDQRLNTQVGERLGLAMKTTGKQGHMIFGPYIPLAAGWYRVTLRGALGEKGLGAARMDVVCDQNLRSLGEVVLSEPDDTGCFVTLPIELTSACTDLEVRVWVSESTELEVASLEIVPGQFPEKYFFKGSHTRFQTQVGTRSGPNIMSTKQAGYLLFGSYLSLAAGQYLVTIRGTAGENGLARARMDIAINKGKFIVAESSLHGLGEDGCLTRVPITLDSNCTDLELRVWVNKKTDVQISMIEITPWTDEQAAANPIQKTGSAGEPQNAVARRTNKERVFENESIAADLISIGSDKLAVTFQPYGFLGFEAKGFGENFFISLGYDVLCFKTTENDWYQAASIEDMTHLAEKYLQHYGLRVGYGSSMGAYAALYFAKALELNKVIAFSPQFSIASSSVPFELRWQESASSLSFKHTPMIGDDGVEVFMLYDPINTLDKKHVNLIRSQFPAGQDIKLPFTGHPSISPLADCEILRHSMECLLDDRGIDIRRTRRAIREMSEEYANNILQHGSFRRASKSARLFNILSRFHASNDAWMSSQGLALGREFGFSGRIDEPHVPPFNIDAIDVAENVELMPNDIEATPIYSAKVIRLQPDKAEKPSKASSPLPIPVRVKRRKKR